VQLFAGELVVIEPGPPEKVTGLDALAARYNKAQSDWTLTVRKVPQEHLDGFLTVGEPRLDGDLVLIKGLGHGGSPVLPEILSPLAPDVAGVQVPDHFWHPDRLWIGFVKRFRLIYYNKDLYQQKGLLPPRTFSDLSDPALRGKLCLRHGDREYNTTLVSHMFNSYGRERTTRLLQSWMNNDPVFVLGDLSGVLENVHNGDCMAGIANSYYFGHFLVRKDLTLDATPVRASLPDRENGAHINMHSLGIIASSGNKDAASSFIRWVFRPNSQAVYSGATYMFSVNPQAHQSVLYPSFLSRFFDTAGVVEDRSLSPLYVEDTRAEVLGLMRTVGWKFKDEIEQ